MNERNGFRRGFWKGCFWVASYEMKIDGHGYTFLIRCGKQKCSFVETSTALWNTSTLATITTHRFGSFGVC